MKIDFETNFMEEKYISTINLYFIGIPYKRFKDETESF